MIIYFSAFSKHTRQGFSLFFFNFKNLNFGVWCEKKNQITLIFLIKKSYLLIF